MRNWSSNAWVLAILSVVLMIVTVDYGRQLVKKTGVAMPGQSEPPKAEVFPDMKVGQPAPDFSLPNAEQKPQTLSKLVKGDTLLCFTCGCSNCRQYQTYVGALNKVLKDKAPEVISVTTGAPEAEAAYKRDVPLKHTMLYEAQGGKIMGMYHGHPCPRVYRLSADRTIKWISPSMNEVPMVQEVAFLTAKELQLATHDMRDSKLPKAPDWELVIAAPQEIKQPVKQAKQPDAIKPVKSPTGGALPPYLQQPTIGN